MAPHLSQFLVTLCGSAMGSRLPRRQAYHAGLHSAVAVGAQRSAETASFIIGMSGNTHESQHGVILQNVQHPA